MGEVMAIERIAEELVRFNGYLTVCNMPFKKGRGHGDLDIIGYRPKDKRILVVECKAWGGSDEYKNFSTQKEIENLRKLVGKIYEDWVAFTKSKTNLWEFKKNELKEIWLIIPGYFKNEETPRQIEEQASSNLGVQVKIMPIHMMIKELFERIKEDKDVRRKRYLDSASELIRWLFRAKECVDVKEFLSSLLS